MAFQERSCVCVHIFKPIILQASKPNTIAVWPCLRCLRYAGLCCKPSIVFLFEALCKRKPVIAACKCLQAAYALERYICIRAKSKSMAAIKCIKKPITVCNRLFTKGFDGPFTSWLFSIFFSICLILTHVK